MVVRGMAVSFGVELPGGVMDGAIEIVRSRERLMSEVMPLQVAPDRFDVVELWGAFRQPLDPEPLGALGERGQWLALLVWIGPLSRTSTIGGIATLSLGP